MFWVNNYVANQAYNRYSQMIPDIRNVQGRLEGKAEADVESAAEALAGADYAAAQNALRELTLATAATVTSDYKNLGDYLLVKYLDGNIKKEADGKFERNPHGMPVQPEFGGYNQRYFKSIVDDAGERLRVVEPNQQ